MLIFRQNHLVSSSTLPEALEAPDILLKNSTQSSLSIDLASWKEKLSILSESHRSLQSLSKEVDALLTQKAKLEEERTLLNKELQPAIDNFNQWTTQTLEKEKLLIELENQVSQVTADILALQ